MKTAQLKELLLQSLEHELGGTKVYATALGCVRNPELKGEWERYFAETKKHVAVLQRVVEAFGFDPEEETPGRAVVRHNGAALVQAMTMAKKNGEPAAAELVACECVVIAETKDHLDWQLIGKCAEHLDSAKAAILKEAYDAIEDQEDEHLYHSKGWCRELWLASLGIPAVLPPPEETKKVRTAIGAARAEASAERAR